MDGTPTSFWGKLTLDAEGIPLRWHPLVDHCADVAASMEALLHQTVVRKRLAFLAGQEDLDEFQIARLCVLAALHDLGKFNLGFQAKANPHASAAEKAGHVAEAVALLNGYGEASVRFAEAIRIEDVARWGSEEAVYELLHASICHHGRPVATERNVLRWVWRSTDSLNPFEGMRELTERARNWFPLAYEDGGLPLPSEPAFVHAFSGLVMLADWIGSDERSFRYRQPGDGERIDFAREAARSFLRRSGIDAHPSRTSQPEPPDFSKVFDGHSPRPAQAVLASVPLPETGPSLTILEAETGAGKTEAALFRFLLLYFAGLVDGMYFALPTRTAATQIYRRIEHAVRRAFPDPSSRPPVLLAVPGYLDVDGVEGRRSVLSRFEVLWNDDDAERFRFRGWAAENTKRYLAAPIAVGTIDQILLSSLRVSHAHLRATSLLRHFLVVDEVHASAAYMSKLLDVVVRRHLQAGGHALLMSATLGASSRTQFLGQELPRFDEAVRIPFPAIFHKERKVEILGTSSGRSKRVRVDVEPSIGDTRSIAGIAIDAARRGAKVLVLRNTVRDCIATQEALESLAREQGLESLLFTCEGSASPHHSRYAREHREALDRAVEASFGKDRPEGGRVAVATQTVQQSLDLDADLLLTDLCPIDVLLQRIGRLHRHERERPPEFSEARTIALVPSDRDFGRLIRKDGSAFGGHGFGTVYPDLRILEATWRCLEEKPAWTVPDDNRFLVECATHPEKLAAIVSELGEPWARHATKMEGTSAAVRSLASVNTYSWERHYSDQPFPTHLDDEKISTRLGAGDRRVLFPESLIGPFSIPFRELTLPAHMGSGASDDESPSDILLQGEAVRFRFAGRTFVYDRLGLRPFDSEDDHGD